MTVLEPNNKPDVSVELGDVHCAQREAVANKTLGCSL